MHSLLSESSGDEDEEEPEIIQELELEQDFFAVKDDDHTYGPPEEADHHIAAEVYTTGKEKKAVLQMDHYAYRGPDLIDYSLYEYCGIISIVPKKNTKNKKDTGLVTEKGSDQDDEEPIHLGSKQGRTPNKTFSFHPSHPLHATHCQRIRSKFKVPVLISNPPKMPPPKPRKPSAAWKKNARAFAQYFLIVFRPWTEEEGTLPASLSWKDFCAWMQDLEFGIRQPNGERSGSSILDTVRRRWVENTGQGNIATFLKSIFRN